MASSVGATQQRGAGQVRMPVVTCTPRRTRSFCLATAKTMVEMNPGANLPAELISVDISSSYATSATPITLLVELMAYTGTGTGTAGNDRRPAPQELAART